MKNKEKIIGGIIIIILSIIFVFSGYIMSRDNRKFVEVEEVFSEPNKKENTQEKSHKESQKRNDKNQSNKESNIKDSNQDIDEIIVDVKGEVNNPREYKLREGSRVRDLIEKAGGLTNDANENLIHFSKVLKDEDCIVIYKNGESTEGVENPVVKEDTLKENKNGKVNINTADVEKLKTLQGIGDSKAKLIIEYREKNGSFKNVDELLNVDGIGSKTLEKLRDNIDIR